MNESQLQIVISLVNDAAGQLSQVGEQLAALGTEATAAAEQMTTSLTEAEEAAADAAMAAASQWDEASGAIVEAVETAASSADAGFMGISDAALAAASEASESWQSSLTDLQEVMSQTAEEIDTEFAGMATAGEEAASKSGSSFASMHNYFRGLIVAYAGEQIGQTLLGSVEAAVSAAAGDPQKIAQLTDEINQQKASIASNQVELTKWYGTTLAVSAAHEKAASDIATSREKVQELTAQLQPLLAQQQAGGEAAKQYDQALQTLNNDWQTHMATIGVQLLPLLTKLLVDIDAVVVHMTAWAEAHPKLTEAMLVFTAVLGGILILAGSLFAIFVVVAVAVGLLGGAFIATGAVIAVAVAAAVALIATNWNLIRNETTKLISDFEGAWNALKTWWDSFWNGIYTTIENVWAKIQSIISAIESAISKVTGPILSIAGAVMGGVGSAMSAITHVQDAIITPSGIVQTDPADYLIATKTPGALAGAGAGNIQIYIQGGTYLDQNGATAIANALARQINMQHRLKNFF